MWPYFLLSGVFMLGFYAREANRRDSPPLSAVGVFLAFVVLTVAIGWRHDVGGDWDAYVYYVERAKVADWQLILARTEPGYNLLNWSVVQLGGDVYTVNILSAAAFSAGLIAFANRQPSPLLVLVVAIPYLVMVVAMGYSRQAVAIGLFLFAINRLERRSVIGYLLCITLAATFHKTAIILAPLAVVLGGQRWWMYTVIIAMASVGLYQQFLASSVEILYENYWEAEYSSQGALIRTLLNVLPAVLFLYWRKRFQLPKSQQQFWLLMSAVSVALLFMLFFAKSSTAVDRVGLYLIPIQLFVWSRLPAAVAPKGGRDLMHWQSAVVGLYVSVQVVWLFFAGHAFAWLPYQSYLAIWLQGA